MSTESERRLPGDGTARTGETGSKSQDDKYGAGAPEAGRRQGADAERVGESAEARNDTERTADPEARRTGDTVEADRPARAPESARADTAAGESATERVEYAGSRTAATSEQATAAGGQPVPLLPEADSDRLRTQWREVQVTFVDDPKTAVARADDLVSGTMDQMIATCQQRKHDLDERRGDTSDTEDLRQALRGYKEFFDQLLSTGA
ncbi:hypothetical protein [Nocardia sp. bgisy134]|uniref:hypothetical protein n=1 Tax=Nocardia sp. bgisy134 TaxID=3413789 RepID=UPI003D753A5D